MAGLPGFVQGIQFALACDVNSRIPGKPEHSWTVRLNFLSLSSLLPRWLMVGFGFQFLLVVLVVGSSIHYLDTLRNELERVVNNQMDRITQAHELRMIIRERILSLDRMFLEDDPFEQDAQYLRFMNLGSRFIEVRRRLEPSVEDVEERRILADFRKETLAATPPIEAVIDLYEQRRLDEGRRLLLREAIPAQAKVIATSDAIHMLYRQRGDAAVEHARQVYNSAFRIVVGLGVGVLVLTLLAAVLVVRRTMRDRESLLAEIEIRRDAEEELRALSSDLEEIVEVRTASLQETTNLLKEAQRIGQMGHWEWDIRGGTLRWSEEVYRLFGRSPDTSITSYETFLQAVYPDDRDKVVAAVEKALTQGRYQVSHRVLWPDGSIRNMQEMGRVTYGEDGRPLRMVGTVQDVTEEQRLQKQLWDMAHHDTLTGLPNRNLLFDHLKQAIALAQRQNGTLAVALLDLDHFKEANDSLGHAAGDRLLLEVANRLRGAVRQSDIVSRFAGDEFVAIFPAVGTPEQVGAILEKVLASLNEPCLLNGTEWHISASIGVAFYPRDGQDGEGLLQAADEAMYAVKQSGRNGYHIYQKPASLQ